MKVLVVHNAYQESGGEDEVVAAESGLLEAHGHAVVRYERHNDEISRYGIIEKASLPLRTVWARDSVRDMRKVLESERPDVAHFHNTFPLVSPGAYMACQEAGVPVVQSLHNPRLICPAATLYRDGHVCEDCLGKTLAWPGVVHGCYRNSRVQTSVVAAMLAVHRYFKTWEKWVDTYIVFSDFYRRKFVQAGLPVRKIVVKPHFVALDPGQARGVQSYALFVGRLAPEKGVVTLLEAWKRLKDVPLKVRGEGPLLCQVRGHACNLSCRLDLVPRLARDELVALFQGARFLVWPSEGYYETFGLVAIEAFACGRPVIASRLGAMEEIVEDGRTGLHFAPGEPEDLAAKVEWAWAHPEEMQEMGRAARREFEEKYTGAANYKRLMEIYEMAMAKPVSETAELMAAR